MAKVKMCPVCDREMGPGKRCPNCKTYVRKPVYFERQSYSGTASAVPGECDCELHMPDMPAPEMVDSTGRSYASDYRNAYGPDRGADYERMKRERWAKLEENRRNRLAREAANAQRTATTQNAWSQTQTASSQGQQAIWLQSGSQTRQTSWQRQAPTRQNRSYQTQNNRQEQASRKKKRSPVLIIILIYVLIQVILPILFGIFGFVTQLY